MPDIEEYTNYYPEADTFSARVGERMRFFRESQGLSVQSMADRMHIDKAKVSLLERNMQTKSLEDLYVYSRALGIPLSELLDIDDTYASQVNAFVQKTHGKTYREIGLRILNLLEVLDEEEHKKRSEARKQSNIADSNRPIYDRPERSESLSEHVLREYTPRYNKPKEKKTEEMQHMHVLSDSMIESMSDPELRARLKEYFNKRLSQHLNDDGKQGS